MKRRHLAVVTIFAVLGAAASAPAQYEVTWYTIDNGGTMEATGGEYEVGGTIGQPDAGRMSSATYIVSGGFWVPRTGGAAPGAPLPAPYPHNRLRNRYIAFDPNKAENDGRDVAFRLTLVSLGLMSCDGSGTPDVEDWACRDDDDCRACSGSGNACWTAPIHCSAGETCDVTGASCVNDQAGSIGQDWWVGAMSADGVHLMVDQANAVYSTDWPETVIVGDCEIVPSATYEVVAVLAGDESDPLTVSTNAAPTPKYWADCVGTLGDYCSGDWTPCPNGVSDCQAGESCFEQWPPPDGFISFVDVQAAAFTFAQLPGLTVTEPLNLDLHGGTGPEDPPNYAVDFNDIAQMIFAFQGFPYPYSDPGDCPVVDAWP